MLPVGSALPIALAFALLWGCGEPTSPDGGTDGGTDAGTDAGNDAGNDAGAIEGRLGAIYLTQGCGPAEQLSCASGSVTFWVSDAGCRESKIGPCTVECLYDLFRPQVSAGRVQIAGTRAANGLVYDYRADAGRYPNPTLDRLWDGGELLTASAAGATVGSFAAASVIAPSPATRLLPTCSATTFDCGTIKRSVDLPVSWSQGGGSVFRVQLSSFSQSPGISMRCDFTSSPAVIPAAALSRFPGPDAGTLFLSSGTIAETTIVAGGYTVLFSAQESAGGGSLSTTD